jgi:hypothetical protein
MDGDDDEKKGEQKTTIMVECPCCYRVHEMCYPSLYFLSRLFEQTPPKEIEEASEVIQ